MGKCGVMALLVYDVYALTNNTPKTHSPLAMQPHTLVHPKGLSHTQTQSPLSLTKSLAKFLVAKGKVAHKTRAEKIGKEGKYHEG